LVNGGSLLSEDLCLPALNGIPVREFVGFSPRFLFCLTILPKGICPIDLARFLRIDQVLLNKEKHER
jgi:hypothetical protein